MTISSSNISHVHLMRKTSILSFGGVSNVRARKDSSYFIFNKSWLRL